MIVDCTLRNVNKYQNIEACLHFIAPKCSLALDGMHFKSSRVAKIIGMMSQLACNLGRTFQTTSFKVIIYISNIVVFTPIPHNVFDLFMFSFVHLSMCSLFSTHADVSRMIRTKPANISVGRRHVFNESYMKLRSLPLNTCTSHSVNRLLPFPGRLMTTYRPDPGHPTDVRNATTSTSCAHNDSTTGGAAGCLADAELVSGRVFVR